MQTTRRGFIPFLGIAAWQPGSARKLRIGIAGGRFGLGFQFHEHPDCIVEAVAELRSDRRGELAKTYRCEKAYTSLETMLRDRNVEAIGLFTPAPDHVRHALLCFEAGKHVLSAVPAAMTLDECAKLADAVKRTGLTYMMAETSYYQQTSISARQMQLRGEFGRIFSCESEYHHAGLESLFVEADRGSAERSANGQATLDADPVVRGSSRGGQRTWRYGFPPMHYPTHCTAHLLGVVPGERLTQVSCLGWGDGDPVLKDNPYQNPFWNETAFFQSNRGTAFRVAVYWKGAHRGGERAQWYGDKMSFFCPHPNGLGAVKVLNREEREKDTGGFVRQRSLLEKVEVPNWWMTEMLPPPLRHNSGHEGSHCFITHEFVTAILQNRKPTVNIHEALAYTAPGIVAHQSALAKGRQLSIPSFDI